MLRDRDGCGGADQRQESGAGEPQRGLGQHGAPVADADLPRRDVSAGGLIVGPGTETSDDIRVWLPHTAMVLNAEVVKVIGVETLDRLNRAHRKMVKARLSNGEYVIRPEAACAIGQKWLDALNVIGLARRYGWDTLEKLAEAEAVFKAEAEEILRRIEHGH